MWVFQGNTEDSEMKHASLAVTSIITVLALLGLGRGMRSE